MLFEEMNIIDRMRLAKKTYVEIARELGLPLNTVKAYCSRHPLTNDTISGMCSDAAGRATVCRYCGANIQQRSGKRERKYCSDACRRKWWDEHRNGQQTERRRLFTCPECGKMFIAYGERKYCSYKCHGMARRKKNE